MSFILFFIITFMVSIFMNVTLLIILYINYINSLINNMIIGVTKGYEKSLEIVGVGYRFNVQGNKIVIAAGYSHPVEMIVPEGNKAEVKDQTQLILTGIDKQQIGEFAANVRKVRPPEPYKGKGIRYSDERIRRKEGKKAA